MAPHEKFGVCLRTSAPSAATLSRGPGQARRAQAVLRRPGPLPLHRQRLRLRRLQEAGDQRRRLRAGLADAGAPRYTKQVATLLAELAPEGINPSIQSAPLGFKPKVTGDHVVDEYTTNVIDVVAHLVELKKKTGKTVTLGLEPEPRCYLETTDETITYFQKHLFSGETAKALAKKTGLNEADAHQAMREYTGIVFDIGHQSVGYEDIAASLHKLVAAGVPIVKLQEAASMRIPEVTQQTVDALQTFAKTIYLSQTCQKKDGKMTWFLNLEDAFEAFQKDPGPREWRTHFHVPVFLTDLGGAFGTTRFALEEALAVHKKTPLSTHLEIETYTWDVLPAHLKTGDIVDYVTRELEWVKGQLT